MVRVWALHWHEVLLELSVPEYDCSRKLITFNLYSAGIFLDIQGDANDYVGKALSGGRIAVYPTQAALDSGFVAQDNVIVGNVCLYGATSGAYEGTYICHVQHTF